MRSRVFEEALIHMKLQTTLIHVNDIEKSTDPNERFNWKVNKEFSKDELKVIEDILAFCSEPQSETKIMRKNDLGVEQLGNWMHYLLSRGLLVGCSGEFVTSKKGQLLLELFTKLRGFFGVNQA